MLLRSSLLKNSSKAKAFTSGTIKGTLSCILKCEVLSITRQPAFAALGAKDGALAEGTEVTIDYEAHIGHSLLSVVGSIFILGIGATFIYYGRE